MFLRHLVPSRELLPYPFFQQIRFLARDPFPTKVSYYLYRAKIIDSIRIALRSNSLSSLTQLLNDRLLDTFVVTHAFRSAPSADSALAIFVTLKSNANFGHNQATIYALATVLAKSGRRDELDALIHAIDARNFKNVRVSYMNFMQWYAAMGDLDLVLTTWDKYRNSDKHVCTESYNIVMWLYARKGMDSKAVEVFHQMIDEGALPNCRTFTNIIEHLVDSGKLDSALEVFTVLPRMRMKRTRKQYSVMIEGFVNVERFVEVKTLLNEIQIDGMLPNRGLIIALQRMKEAGYSQEVDDVLHEMLPDDRIRKIEDEHDEDDDDDDDNDINFGSDTTVVEGIQLKPWLDPKALANALNNWNQNEVSELQNAEFVWTSRLVCKILRNFKSPEAAWEFFCWVSLQPEFSHDVYTIQRMMTLLAKHGRVQLIDQLMMKIQKEGLSLPFSTIRLIIDFFGLSKNPDAALKVFHHDRALCGKISNFKLMLLYSSLLRTLTKCGRNSKALETLDEMILNGIFPDIQTFTGLMDHFAKQGDLKIVQRLFTMVRQSGIEPDSYMYKVLIHGYCKSDRAVLALRVYDDMRVSGRIPDFGTKDLLMRSLWKEGKRKEAAAVEESCEGVDHWFPLAVKGHVWTVSSADLMRVYDIYASTFVPVRDEAKTIKRDNCFSDHIR